MEEKRLCSLMIVLHDAFKINTKFEPGSVKQDFVRSISMVCTTYTLSLLPSIIKA